MNEEWKPVVGYEGFYEVSDMGNVRTLPRRVKTRGNNKTRPVNAHTLRPYPDAHGYLNVKISHGDGLAKRHKVHQLVAAAFIGEPPAGKPGVLHWNDQPRDNRVSNLRYGNRRENIADAIRNGILPDWRVTPPSWKRV